MHLVVTRLFIILFALCLLIGCTDLPHASPLKHYTGHWTVGAPFSEFVVPGERRAFYVFSDDMPSVAYNFLKAQPEHRDGASESGSSVSAYFEVTGRLIPYKDSFIDPDTTYQRLHVEQVLRMEPARADYLASLVKRTH